MCAQMEGKRKGHETRGRSSGTLKEEEEAGKSEEEKEQGTKPGML